MNEALNNATIQLFTYLYALLQQFYIFVTVFQSPSSPRRYADQHICVSDSYSRTSCSNHEIRKPFSIPIWIILHVHVELGLTLYGKAKPEVLQNKLLKGMFGNTADRKAIAA